MDSGRWGGTSSWYSFSKESLQSGAPIFDSFFSFKNILEALTLRCIICLVCRWLNPLATPRAIIALCSQVKGSKPPWQFNLLGKKVGLMGFN